MTEPRIRIAKPVPPSPEYTVDTFQAAHDLSPEQALDLFTRFGPLRAELDPMVKVMKNRRLFDDLLNR